MIHVQGLGKQRIASDRRVGDNSDRLGDSHRQIQEDNLCPVRSPPLNLRGATSLSQAAAATTAITFPTIIPSSALGRDGAVAPSERIVLGGIGIRNRGGYVLSFLLNQPDTQFVAMADVRADRRTAVKAMADKQNGDAACDTYRDFRELLDRDDIDAVLIATGDRWHAPASMLAAEAGKDVYSEKPCAITMELSRRLAETIKRTGRVFQAGTQRRNVSNFQHAARLAWNGSLGNLKTLHASIYQLEDRHDWLPAEPEPDPNDIDWNMWLGPAPWRPYNRRYVDGGWRGFYDFDFRRQAAGLGCPHPGPLPGRCKPTTRRRSSSSRSTLRVTTSFIADTPTA